MMRRRLLSPLDPDALPIPLHEPKKQCTHSMYGLSCREYDGLLWRSGNRCEICRARPEDVQSRPLYIDHDSRLGTTWDHVRGLLCARCNSQLRYVDNGHRRPTPEQQHYLDNAWFWAHLPPDRLEKPWYPQQCRNPNWAVYWWHNPNPRWFPWRVAQWKRWEREGTRPWMAALCSPPP